MAEGLRIKRALSKDGGGGHGVTWVWNRREAWAMQVTLPEGVMSGAKWGSCGGEAGRQAGAACQQALISAREMGGARR